MITLQTMKSLPMRSFRFTHGVRCPELLRNPTVAGGPVAGTLAPVNITALHIPRASVLYYRYIILLKQILQL